MLKQKLSRKKLKPLAGVAAFQLKSLKKHQEKEEKVNSVEKLLKPIERIQLDGNESEHDAVSEISDVFEEFHANSFMKRQGDRYLTKHEADLKTLAMFTDEFKRAIFATRQSLQLSDQFYTESMEKITEIIKNPPLQHIEFKKTNVEIESLVPSISGSNSSSESDATWHMLSINFDKNKFHITPPVFDTFRQKAPHWLEKVPVQWEEINESRIKCEEWLAQNC